jgi:hypothetical protein
VLLCNDYEYHTNFHGICLEDQKRHRVTAVNTTIDILQAEPATQVGYWVGGNQQLIRQAEPVTEAGYWVGGNQQLLTRIQPEWCRFLPENATERCLHSERRGELLSTYEFKWHHGGTGEHWLKTPDAKMCFFGASHARELSLMTASLGISTEQFEATFVQDITSELIQNAFAEHACKKVIIGIGQWDASWVGGNPTLFPTFEQLLETALLGLANSSLLSPDLLFRTMHYNPIGDWVGSCAPNDWRNPRVVDGYNDIIKRVATKFNLSVIDTNHIVSPLWDKAPDWCHLDPVVQKIEAIYIMNKVWDVDKVWGEL